MARYLYNNVIVVVSAAAVYLFFLFFFRSLVYCGSLIITVLMLDLHLSWYIPLNIITMLLRV